VKNLPLMWGLYQKSKLWSTRPCALLGIDDPYVSYCVDEAVGSWGMYVENELDKIEGKNGKDTARKQHNKLLQLLDAPSDQRFRSLRASRGPGTVTK
jgi:hypothetical protein